MLTIKDNKEKSREEKVLDAGDRFTWDICLSRTKYKIRNTLFKYQIEMFNQRDLDGNVSLNNVAHSSGYT